MCPCRAVFLYLARLRLARALAGGATVCTGGASFVKSPSFDFSGQIEKAGHFLQPTAIAIGQMVIGDSFEAAASIRPMGRRWHHRAMTAPLNPPFIEPSQLGDTLRRSGHAALSPQGMSRLIDADPQALMALRGSWNDLPPDAYLRDGGRYRRRRHSCFIVEGGMVVQAPHRAHWQPVEYNALHGGLERWFEAMDPAIVAQPVWEQLLSRLAGVCSALKGVQPWYVEAHQFRIDTADGIGRPTPEGAHRDGVDFVVVALVDRAGVKGGETRIFDAEGPSGIRFTMSEPWTTLMLDDERVIHETTPIQPIDAAAPGGHRDTLVLTFRAGAFQGPAVR